MRGKEIKILLLNMIALAVFLGVLAWIAHSLGEKKESDDWNWQPMRAPAPQKSIKKIPDAIYEKDYDGKG